MFKKLLDRFKKKPKEETFKIKDLYVGEIVFLVDKKFIRRSIDYEYQTVKKGVFLTEIGYGKYSHIKSGQKLIEMNTLDSKVGDYAVFDLKKFEDQHPIYMRKANLTPEDKFTKSFICEIEDTYQKKYAPNHKVDELFQ